MSDLNATENAAVKETAAPAQAKPAPTGLRVILGEKMGMTQLFDSKGRLRPVTVIKAGPCTVTNVRTPERDGYSAVCLGFGQAKKRIHKAQAEQYAKLGVPAHHFLKEFRLGDVAGYEAGQVITVDTRFAVNDFVDVQGVSKGHGFAGGMKRHGFRGMPGSHGASDKERAPGSLASRRSLGRVIPGQRMAGHFGQETNTVVKMEVVKVDAARNLIYINGAVPGTVGSMVTVLETSRPQKKRVEAAVVDKKAKKGAKPAAAKPAAKK